MGLEADAQPRAQVPWPPLCVKNTALLGHPSPQTVCIEKIPAHLVSFLLLLASAGTICGLKRHALKDRKERTRRRTQEGNRSSGEIL